MTSHDQLCEALTLTARKRDEAQSGWRGCQEKLKKAEAQIKALSILCDQGADHVRDLEARLEEVATANMRYTGQIQDLKNKVEAFTAGVDMWRTRAERAERLYANVSRANAALVLQLARQRAELVRERKTRARIHELAAETLTVWTGSIDAPEPGDPASCD